MSYPPGLAFHGKGWRITKRIPEDLRPYYAGKAHLRYPTGTSDKKAAADIAWRWLADTAEEFTRKRPARRLRLYADAKSRHGRSGQQSGEVLGRAFAHCLNAYDSTIRSLGTQNRLFFGLIGKPRPRCGPTNSRGAGENPPVIVLCSPGSADRPVREARELPRWFERGGERFRA